MKKFKPDTKILWMDAHIDANTPESSPSKNAHGMPLAFLSGIIPYY
jgi:arginase